MEFPLLTVTEKDGGISVRQDRFLATGPASEKDNQTIWYRILVCSYGTVIN